MKMDENDMSALQQTVLIKSQVQAEHGLVSHLALTDSNSSCGAISKTLLGQVGRIQHTCLCALLIHPVLFQKPAATVGR